MSFEERYHRILFIGPQDCGKTSILKKYKQEDVSKPPESTIAASRFVFKFPTDDELKFLEVWDISGHDRYLRLGPIYYDNIRAVVFVYDVYDPNSYIRMRSWIRNFNYQIEKIIETQPTKKEKKAKAKEMKKVKYFVVANKVDKLMNLPLPEEVSQFAEKLNAPLFEVSAHANIGIQSLFGEIFNTLEPNFNYYDHFIDYELELWKNYVLLDGDYDDVEPYVYPEKKEDKKSYNAYLHKIIGKMNHYKAALLD